MRPSATSAKSGPISISSKRRRKPARVWMRGSSIWPEKGRAARGEPGSFSCFLSSGMAYTWPPRTFRNRSYAYFHLGLSPAAIILSNKKDSLEEEENEIHCPALRHGGYGTWHGCLQPGSPGCDHCARHPRCRREGDHRQRSPVEPGLRREGSRQNCRPLCRRLGVDDSRRRG